MAGVSFASLYLFSACFLIMFQCHDARYLIPHYLTCPGINEADLDAKPQVRIGIMFGFPTSINETQLYEEAGLDPGEVLPGKLLLPYIPLARRVYVHAISINNRGTILPYHHLCLYFTFIRNDFYNIGRGSNHIYVHNRVRQVISAINDPQQHDSNSELVIHYSPLITIDHELSVNICPYEDISSLLRVFLGVELILEDSCTDEVRDTKLKMAPPHSSIYSAAYTFVKRMGWQKFGVITTCCNLIELWILNENTQLGYYVPSRFIEMFKNSGFETYELNIYVFIGPLADFCRLLIAAYDYGFATSFRTYVWITLSFNSNISESDILQSGNFTEEEKAKVMHMLPGLILIQPLDTCYSSVLKSGALVDALTTHSKAAMSLLEEKAAKRGLNISEVILERDDYDNITLHLFNTSFYGYTGEVEFDGHCNRISNTFVVNNFEKKPNESVSHDVKALIMICHDKEPHMDFIDSSTGLKTDVSTIIFQDGLVLIPPDHIKRMYIRNNHVVVLCLVIMIFIYLIMITVYVAIVHKEDKNADIYNESWLYQDNDISYSIDQSGINIMLSWLSYNGEQTIGQINSTNNAVYIHRAKLNMSQLNVKMRKKILAILEFKHDNICPFVGGILQGSFITGIMYEYCTRGTLYGLLINPHICFNKSFRQSFAIDCSKGLAYLHGRKTIHGRLTSNNCVIDQHWNLKLTDYEPPEMHYTKLRRKRSMVTTTTLSKKVYYSPDQDTFSDVYNFGIILTELCCRKALVQFGSINLGKVIYDEDVSEGYIELIDKCLQMKRTARPTANFIKVFLKDCLMFYTFHFKNDTAAAELYSRNLERHILELNSSLQDEKNLNGYILANHVPKIAVKAIQNKSPLPMRLSSKTAILCFGLCDIDDVLSLQANERVAKTIKLVDRLLDGFANTFNLHRIQSSGSIWTYIGFPYERPNNHTSIQDVFQCAMKLLVLFQGRADSQQKLKVRMSLHSGDLICGVVNETIPFHAAVGSALSFASYVMMQCPVNTMLITSEAKSSLPNRFDLRKFKSLKKKNGRTYKLYMINVEDYLSMMNKQGIIGEFNAAVDRPYDDEA